MRRAVSWLWVGALLWAGERSADWREALELDEAPRVVAEARAAFEADGTLARDGELVALRARALALTGEAARARELLESAGVSAATRAPVELGLARLDLDEDRLEAVVDRLRTEPGGAPRHGERAAAWWLLGKALARRGDLGDAAPYLRHFVDTWPLDVEAPAAWHLLAQEALARRDLDLARRCRDRGRELSTWHGFYKTRRLQVRAQPDAPLPRLGLAQLWISIGELERARAELLELTRRAPDFARGWAALGEVERGLGHGPAAREAYRRTLELDPEHDDARFNRALLALAAGDDAAARPDLEQLVEGESGEAQRYLEAHLHLARLLARNGEAEAASLRYARYRELGGTEVL